MAPMQDTSALEQLITAYKQLDVAAQPQRAKELLTQAAAQVDRSAAPKKWAALRSLFADLCEHDDPVAAIAAYRDALSVWDPVEQRDPWVHCHLQLGCLLANATPGSADAEHALVHLQQAVGDHPYLARMLATLYGFRPLGDPQQNWRQRITYLELALAQTGPKQDLSLWATISNELACALQDEPAGDYAAALEKRIVCHQRVLETLRAGGGPVVDTCMHLATAYLDRVQGTVAANGQAADAFLQEALRAGAEPADPAQTVQLLLLRARILTFKQEPMQLEPLHTALAVLVQARGLAADRPQPELRGSVEKLFALAYLELLQRGQHQHRQAFVDCCGLALTLFEGPAFATERRKLLQIQADGLLLVGDFAAAGDCCAQVMRLAESRLAQVATTHGRLERIWELRESASLLAYCHARGGDLRAAVDALDAGKARLWSPGARGPASAGVADLLPPQGALLLPVFAGAEGLVILVTHGDDGPRFTCVKLPLLGKARVLQLQRGADANLLGGWLHAYCYRRSAPDRFHEEIAAMGALLHSEFWAPVFEQLTALGVSEGAELVLFPQGASASLPLQAASWLHDGQRRWLSERYALRFAPSMHTLSRLAAPRAGAALLTVVAPNPQGDLRFNNFEVAWVQAVRADTQVLQVLAGADATRERVLAALHTSSQVHIATHAEFDVDDPFASRLQVWGGALSVLTLVDHLAAGRPDFIALSACETGVTRVTSLADEFLGFPAALLEAGVRTVLATHWSVDDEATALLMGQFYREQAGGSTSSAQALRRAQNWLRGLTVAELSRLLREMRDRPGVAGELAGELRAGLRGRDAEDCPFAHPYFWAGFCVLGGS